MSEAELVACWHCGSIISSHDCYYETIKHGTLKSTSLSLALLINGHCWNRSNKLDYITDIGREWLRNPIETILKSIEAITEIVVETSEQGILLDEQLEETSQFE